MTEFPEYDPYRHNTLQHTANQIPTIQEWTLPEESARILATNFSRVFRKYVDFGFASHEQFIDLTNINRGHERKMGKGDVDCKISMLFRCSRSVGNCPSMLVCEMCIKSFGSCPVAFPANPLPPDIHTLKDLNAFCLKNRMNPRT